MIEAWGRGIEQMQVDCAAQGAPGPVLRHETTGLWVEFENRAPEKTPEEMSEEVSEKTIGTTLKTTPETTLETTQKILAVLRQNPSANRREIAASLGDITEYGVRYNLDKLKSEGRIRRVGPTKGGHWQVIENDE